MSARIKFVTILGSGTSTGVPVIGCSCSVCSSGESKNQRFRASIMLTTYEGKNIVVDTGPEFRLQMLRQRVDSLASVIYTHIHADHCHGFDDLRSFYFLNKQPVNCFMHKRFAGEFKQKFSYAFEATGYLGNAPQIQLNEIEDGNYEIAGLEFEFVSLPHGNIETVAFRVGEFIYATDFKQLPAAILDAWKGKVSVMVASGLRFAPQHPTHQIIPEALKTFENLGVRRGIISHLTHDVEYFEASQRMPEFAEIAFDGMRIEL